MTIEEARFACDVFYEDLVEASHTYDSEVAFSFIWKAEGCWHGACEYLDEAESVNRNNPNNCMYSSEVAELLVVVEDGLKLANKLLAKSREF